MLSRRFLSVRPLRRIASCLVPVLAACSAPSGPAPVVHRDSVPVVRAPIQAGTTVAPPVAAAPGVPAPGAAAPAPPVVAAAPPPAGSPVPGGQPPSVMSAPVHGGRLESRPLDARPLPPPAADVGTRTEPAPPPAVATPDDRRAQVEGARGAPGPAAPAARGAPAAPPARGAEHSLPPVAVAPPSVASPPAAASSSRFVWPAEGSVTKRFGDPKSLGIAIEGHRGDPVSAAADGKVIFSGLGPKGYGKLLIVKHADDLLSVYANNSSLLVREGQAVRQGQKIAELGAGAEGKPGLHFEIRRQGKPVDPLPYLPRR
ncbi:MAG: peptidoglycan DD-metalloendopeptidase family protein [Burkholderiaceae bacterium]